jgi:thiamine-phosphate pyrophosphorylase
VKAPERPRLYLIARPGADVLSALEGGDVAAVELSLVDQALVAAIQDRGVAVLLRDDVAPVETSGADGVYLSEAAADVASARKALGPTRTIGAFAATRHGAMLAGEAGADVVAFEGLDLLGWWAETMVVPCLARGPQQIADAVASGADFIAVADAVWTHPDGARAGLAALNAAVDTAWSSW